QEFGCFVVPAQDCQGGPEYGGGLQRAVVGGAEAALALAEAVLDLVFGVGGPVQGEQRRGSGQMDRAQIVRQRVSASARQRVGARSLVEDVPRLIDGGERLLSPAPTGQRAGRTEVQHHQEPALALSACVVEHREQ
ncbi:hypothetical protein ACWDZ8_23730, partial [Streptomyces sp. NPDC003233]